MKCDNFLRKIHLFNRQKALNRMFEEEGLTDEILQEQILLNRERNELDIEDPSEADDDGYVQ